MPRFQSAPFCTNTAALEAPLPTATLAAPVAFTRLLPPSMYQTPLSACVEPTTGRRSDATALAALEVVSVPPAKVKNELVAPPDTLLVTSSCFTLR